MLAETPSYAVVYKPACMHTVPLCGDRRNRYGRDGAAAEKPRTLLDWYAALFPDVRAVRGRQAWEYGVLHRLDFATRGLVFIAKTQYACDALMREQEQGLFVKTYRAESAGHAGGGAAVGFPPCPYSGIATGGVIESAFRAFGPGRASVRPVLTPFPKNKDIALDHGAYYKTEIIEKIEKIGKAEDKENAVVFRIHLARGFRHQIRCHLAWLGYPLLNDSLYGGVITDAHRHPAPIGLCAIGLQFIDPAEKAPVSYTLDTGAV
ncbi:MAG: RNA pseudouridine synthase [Treponema sp.]|jgi:23S rRNA pseudouridine1911/1915/1917 synthase|nr:RNA pseudouridine synthase [Treponema sp.]